jgi:hypothetical protein
MVTCISYFNLICILDIDCTNSAGLKEEKLLKSVFYMGFDKSESDRQLHVIACSR